MTLVRWGPFRDLVGYQEEMNRLFNDFISRSTDRPEEAKPKEIAIAVN